jgi:hypothetical protein
MPFFEFTYVPFNLIFDTLIATACNLETTAQLKDLILKAL